VRDNGKGCTPEQIRKLFDFGHSSSQTGKEIYSFFGTGFPYALEFLGVDSYVFAFNGQQYSIVRSGQVLRSSVDSKGSGAGIVAVGPLVFDKQRRCTGGDTKTWAQRPSLYSVDELSEVLKEFKGKPGLMIRTHLRQKDGRAVLWKDAQGNITQAMEDEDMATREGLPADERRQYDLELSMKQHLHMWMSRCFLPEEVGLCGHLQLCATPFEVVCGAYPVQWEQHPWYVAQKALQEAGEDVGLYTSVPNICAQCVQQRSRARSRWCSAPHIKQTGCTTNTYLA
jgi:hypothetical protein